MRHWVEKYDEVSAKATINKLLKHWQHTPKLTSKDKRAPSQSPDIVFASESEDGETSDPKSQVCSHMACSQASSCVIDQLEVVKSHYQGIKDQFKIKAIDRAIRQYNPIPDSSSFIVVILSVKRNTTISVR